MSKTTKVGVIIAAAGSGARFGHGAPKQWRPLAGVSLVERAWRSFLKNTLGAAGQKCIPIRIVIVVAEDMIAEASFCAGDAITSIVAGGATRTESVRRGLEALGEVDLIAVHDAARPLWPLARWDQLIGAARTTGAAILAVPIVDTIKSPGRGRTVTVAREGLWAAQTPQVFAAGELREAHEAAERNGVAGTDDAELVELNGGSVTLVPSVSTNLKITTAEDWRLAELLTRDDAPSLPVRTGIGYDAHRLGGDGPLVLGGVTLASTGGLIGHSDGDVLLHAICDALLGAAAQGDIGLHFPPGDPQYAGVDSRVLLRRTGDILRENDFQPAQIDAVVMAEAPRLAPHAEAMRANIAADLRLDLSAVSVKATTTEGMGFVGRREGIAAQATATILPIMPPAGGPGGA